VVEVVVVVTFVSARGATLLFSLTVLVGTEDESCLIFSALIVVVEVVGASVVLMVAGETLVLELLGTEDDSDLRVDDTGLAVVEVVVVDVELDEDEVFVAVETLLTVVVDDDGLEVDDETLGVVDGRVVVVVVVVEVVAAAFSLSTVAAFAVVRLVFLGAWVVAWVVGLGGGGRSDVFTPVHETKAELQWRWLQAMQSG
jgi:hypothetical protein